MKIVIRRALLGVLACASAVVGMGVALPAAAGAYATLAPPPLFSSAPGLPDGRVYEQVSPANKYGYGTANLISDFRFLGNAVGGGNGIIYIGEGPLAEGSTTGSMSWFVSQRSAGGWSTRTAMPRAVELHSPEKFTYFEQDPLWVFPSADLSHVAFSKKGAGVGPPDKQLLGNNLFLEGSDPSLEPAWVGRPQIAGPLLDYPLAVAGGSPDLGTLYFAFSGTLLAADAPRGKVIEEANIEKGIPGFYEYRDGVLSEAGVLPDGSVSALGAVPASLPVLHESFPSEAPDQADGQVSADGSRAFFVSPAPIASGATPYWLYGGCECTAEPPQLYVRETAADGSQRTVLVSQSRLAGHVGEAAPNGPLLMTNTARSPEDSSFPSYVFASPDGSRAFFQSVDRLTEGAPAGSAPKMYMFDLETGALEYLPGVTGSIVVSARDGSSLVFENTATSPFELDRWVAGSAGGSVTPIVQLPGPEGCHQKLGFGSFQEPSVVCVGSAHLSTDGSVAVFTTEASITGFNDGGGHEQIFRYDSRSNGLSCVSCPPVGVAPSGDAVMSRIDYETGFHDGTGGSINDLVDARGMSVDGGRVFFDTPAPLVAQDVNGQRDVYEWENGRVFLLSSGSSSKESVFLDNGESGGDVFFDTTSELAPGDNDGVFDMYDARVPRPGDKPPPIAVPCQGEVCQGPPSVPQLLSAPSSETFSGLGNITPPPQAQRPAKAKKPSKGVKRRRSRRKGRSGKRGKKAGRASVVAARRSYGRGR